MDEKSLFEFFKTAIENEREAHKFYKSIADNATDPDTRELFAELAQTELDHEKRLEKRYKELKERV